MRSIAKKLVFYASCVIVSPMITASRLEGLASNGEAVFYLCGNLLSLVPGIVGSYLRCAYYYGTLDGSSQDVYIGFGSFFAHKTARLGRKVVIGAYCVIGSADIGDNVLIASRVSVLSGKHQHAGASGEITHGITRLRTVRIGGGSWIGEGSIVMADLGEKCVVGAGSVVTKDTPDNIMLSGNPARVLSTFAKEGSQGSTIAN